MLEKETHILWLALVIGFVTKIETTSLDECSVVMQSVLKRLGSVEEEVLLLKKENKVLKEDNQRILKLTRDKMVEDDEVSFRKREDKTETLSETITLQNDTANQTDFDGTTMIPWPRIRSFKRGPVDSSAHVAFQAGLSHLLKSLGSNQIVVYDKILLNVGNAYNKYSGQMTAPVKGLYLLFFSIYALPTHESALAIVLNGMKIDTLYALGSDLGDHISQSRTIPMVLEKGDTVWVKNYPGYEGRDLYGEREHYFNSFAGVLLYEY